MVIEFDAKSHTYAVDGEIAHISVTELLHKHGLAPNYGSVDKDVLSAAAERGKTLHKEFENIINSNDYEPETEYGKLFADYAEKNIQAAVAEQVVAYEYEGMVFAGTADLVAITKDGDLMIADHKTTNSFDKEYVAWQTSLLDYILRSLDGRILNGDEIHWQGAKKLLCLWYHDGKMDVKELQKVDDTEIVRLIESEFFGNKYVRPVLAVDENLQLAIEEAERVLAECETAKKVAEERAKTLREQLCNAMRMQGITHWETPHIKATYVPAFDRNGVDSAKLKKNYPQVWADVQKLTKVKDTVRITVISDSEQEEIEA